MPIAELDNQPIRFGTEGSANDFGNSFLVLAETLMELFTNRNPYQTPQIVTATSGDRVVFTLSLLSFDTDGRLLTQARCAHIRVNQVVYKPFLEQYYYTVEIEFIGDISTKPLYCGLLRMVADMPGAPRQVLTDKAVQCEDSLSDDVPLRKQAIAKVVNEEWKVRSAYEWLQKQIVDEQVRNGILAPEKAESHLQTLLNELNGFEAFSKAVRRAKADMGGHQQT